MNPKSHKGEGHRRRLQQKFLKSGLRGFHDYEIVELLTQSYQSCKKAKSLLEEAKKRVEQLIEAR